MKQIWNGQNGQVTNGHLIFSVMKRKQINRGLKYTQSKMNVTGNFKNVRL